MFQLAYLRFAALILITALLIDVAFAQETVTGKSLFGWLRPYIDELVGIIIAAFVGWVAYFVQKYTGLKISAEHRAVVDAFVRRKAAELVSDGMVKVEGLEFKVSNPALAAVAKQAETAIPLAVNYFGLTPEKIAERINAALPQIPAAAAVAAAQAAPAPVVPVPGGS